MSQHVSKEAAPPSTHQAEGAHARPLDRTASGSWRSGSIGVVFGDIGTSPLYALQTALGQFKESAARPAEVIGVVSLIIWALLIVVTAKYVLFLMQADNKGEGGILSLMALAQRALGRRTTIAFRARRRRRGAVFRRRDDHAGDFGPLRARRTETGRRRSRALRLARDDRHSRAALHRPEPGHRRRRRILRADHGRLLPRQRRCSACSTSPSAWSILRGAEPDPRARLSCSAHGAIGFIVLGSVFLAVTGAEALYADMGHFGRRPIQAAWLFLVLPALVCNYLGQGALDPQRPESGRKIRSI